jgi:hypothetical protein
MRSTRLLPVFAGAAVLAGGMAVLAPAAAQASVACSQTALVAAINLANTSGGGNVTLTPGCTYTLTRSHGGGTHGPDGLPIITTVITLTGNANVITRSGGLFTPDFRIAEVSATGNLTLKSVTLSNGSSSGDGGGILNFGAVTLTSSSLKGNTTLLGNGGGIASGPGAGAAVTFTSSTLAGNTALTGSGGGLYSQGGTATLTSTPVNGNTSLTGNGGGIATIDAVLTITSSPVSSNAASLVGGKGGGIYRQGTPAVTVTTSPISGNSPNNCAGSVPAVPNCTG